MVALSTKTVSDHVKHKNHSILFSRHFKVNRILGKLIRTEMEKTSGKCLIKSIMLYKSLFYCFESMLDPFAPFPLNCGNRNTLISAITMLKYSIEHAQSAMLKCFSVNVSLVYTKFLLYLFLVIMLLFCN